MLNRREFTASSLALLASPGVAQAQTGYPDRPVKIIVPIGPGGSYDLVGRHLADVLAKRDAAVKWCQHASAHALTCGGKPWKYVLIPHDVVAENMTLAGLTRQFAEK